MTAAGGTDRIDPSSLGPAGDIACAFGLAFGTARVGSDEDLARGLIPPVREIDDGVEVSFTVQSEDAVRRYVERESRRNPAVSFSVRRTSDAIVLTVTGPREA